MILLENTISLDSYVHPQDEKIKNKIYNSAVTKKMLDSIFTDNLDEINEYVYKSSYIEVPKSHIVYKYMREGCEMFGVNKTPSIYYCRSYDLNITCMGYSNPAVLLPDSLLKTNDDEIIRARILGCAASIKAEHHKLLFFNWFLEHTGGQIQKLFIDKIIEGYLIEWKRASVYTVDRAVLLAVNDLKLALKNILFGRVPPEILDQFQFGLNDTFLPQVNDFFDNKGFIDIASSLYGILQLETWLPKRYRELQNFYAEICGGKSLCILKTDP